MSRGNRAQTLFGVHAVSEALRAGREVHLVHVARGADNPRVREIVKACGAQGVAVRQESRQALDKLTRGGVHQGVVAEVAPRRRVELAEVIAAAGDEATVVLLAGVEDPHNLGAIVRSAHAAGADAVVVQERRAAKVNETVAKAAAGALEYLPVVTVTNLNRALDGLRDADFWVYGLDGESEYSLYAEEVPARVALVLGAEGAGLREHTAKRCDRLLAIPMAGAIASLNVSVAAGVVLFEVVRQRGTREQTG